MVFNHDLEAAILQLANIMDKGDGQFTRFFLTPENLTKYFSPADLSIPIPEAIKEMMALWLAKMRELSPSLEELIQHSKALAEAGLIHIQIPMEDPNHVRLGGITYAGRVRLYDLLRDKMLGYSLDNLHVKINEILKRLDVKNVKAD